MSSDYEKALEAAKGSYNSTKAPSTDPLNGEYQFVLAKAEMKTYEKEGVPILAAITHWKVVTPGEKVGREIDVWDRLVDARGIGYFKQKLIKMKIDPETPLEDLEVTLKQAVGILVTGRSKANVVGDRVFYNLYINSFDGKLED